MARLRHNIALCCAAALLLIAVACEATPTPTPTPALSPAIGNLDTAANMHTPTLAAPQFSIFDHTNGHTVVCSQMAGEYFQSGENFNMPKVDPATNGIDEWTLRTVEPNDIGDSYPMPVLPDGIPSGECVLLDEPATSPAP
jgi:hypothetical protein